MHSYSTCTLVHVELFSLCGSPVHIPANTFTESFSSSEVAFSLVALLFRRQLTVFKNSEMTWFTCAAPASSKVRKTNRTRNCEQQCNRTSRFVACTNNLTGLDPNRPEISTVNKSGSYSPSVLKSSTPSEQNVTPTLLWASKSNDCSGSG